MFAGNYSVKVVAWFKGVYCLLKNLLAPEPNSKTGIGKKSFSMRGCGLLLLQK
jgi:hypothetical protein